MPGKRSKHPSFRKQIRQLQIGSTILFFLYLCLTGFIVYEVYLFGIKGPDPYYLENETEPMMCHCYLWGCYCCEPEISETIHYDLKRNVSDLGVYRKCTRSVYLDPVQGKRSIQELSCYELIDYYDNGRRCSGTFNNRCIYPYIWNEKAVLEEQIRVKNCTDSVG